MKNNSDYVEEVTKEWNAEWEFRQHASKVANEKTRVKQQERLDAFLAMVRGREGLDQNKGGRNIDERPRFGMPYGEWKKKVVVKKVAEDLQEEPFSPEVKKEVKVDTPILSQIMEEKEIESKNITFGNDASEVTEPATAGEGDNSSNATLESQPSTDVTEEATGNDKLPDTLNEADVPGHDKPIDNLSLVQDTTKTDKYTNNELSESEKAAAEQRAANAKIAQQKADERVKQRLDAENKKKEDAKVKAEAILKHAEEKERLRIEKEKVEAEQRKKEEEEAARLAEQEAEEARLQAEQEAARLHEVEEREKEEEARVKAEEEEQARLHQEAIQQRIDVVESKMQPITDKATSVTFNPKLGDGLYLVGAGVRKKAILNVYSVAMYSSPSVLEAVSVFPKQQKKEAQVALRDAARNFDSSSPMTSFMLEMTLKADGKTIASAIADSVKPRYSGPEDNIKELESLIFEGVKSKGGQATKGTIFRFDCSAEGVSVSVDGDEQGIVECKAMGSAFVDVFLDGNAVSPKLIDSCLDTWSGSGL
jgi:hypothetical protein